MNIVLLKVSRDILFNVMNNFWIFGLFMGIFDIFIAFQTKFSMFENN